MDALKSKLKELTFNWRSIHGGLTLNEAKRLPIPARYEFVSYLSRCTRTHFSRSRSFQCYQYCVTLASMVAYMDMPSVLVNWRGKTRKESHWGLDIELHPSGYGNWSYFDPFFEFSARHGNRFLPSYEIKSLTGLIESWDNHFNNYYYCFDGQSRLSARLKNKPFYYDLSEAECGDHSCLCDRLSEGSVSRTKDYISLASSFI
tara:strand:- start:72 stop:680 length:609 start_codon:yes stop_codon:yes gene_type:complete